MRSLPIQTVAASLLCLAAVPFSVQSENLTCPIQEKAVGDGYEWRVTDTSCPIGLGFWGKNAPSQDQGVFWIQCAYTKEMPGSWFIQLLTNIIPENKTLLRQEPGQYRCLVGPYASYSEALALQSQMASNPVLKDAFIRTVADDLLVEEETVVADTDIAVPPPAAAAAVPIAEEVAIAESARPTMAREFHQIGNLYSPIPIGEDPNYTELDKTWIRAPFQTANEICTQSGMKVVSPESLRLAADDPNIAPLLPKRLPYWVADKTAFDIVMMVPISLTENSAIYVLCE